MRHRVSGRKLNRTTSHRRALRRNLAASLIEHGAIRTTEEKAKELRPFVERLITIAKKGTLHARRVAIARLGDRDIVDEDGKIADQTVIQKLFDELARRYVDRPGGYTRIIRLAERRIGDAGRQVLLQLIDETSAAEPESPTGAARRKKRATKRHEATGAVAEVAQQHAEVEGDQGQDAAEQGAQEEAPPEGDE